MSRCFPYPPPGYYGNGATHDALIESIKLQKETNKTKTDRKKEKKEKKEKRQKEKRNNEDSHKVLQNSEAYNQKTKAVTELLEKSDLTQEDGQPISSHQPSYSSDSTQNSNKRKRDDYSLLTDNSTGHGSFKIRFLKKQKGSDSSSFVSDVRSNTHPSVSSFSSDRSLASCNGRSGVPATSGRENRTQTQIKSTPLSEGTTISDTNRLHIVQSALGSGRPPFQSSRPQVPPRVHLEYEIPSSSVSRTIDDQKLYYGKQQQPTTSHHVMSNLVSNKTTAANGGVTMQKEEPQKVGPTRAEKKMLKKHAKYEKLIKSWLPPVFQADILNDDWLSSSKTGSSSISKGEVETCRESVASWQPCAQFLADVDMHALPYTVPF